MLHEKDPVNYNAPIMKNRLFPKVLLSLSLGLLFSSFAVAQESQVVTPLELGKLLRKAYQLLDESPFRVKMTVEKAKNLEDGWTPYSYQETEEIRPDKIHGKQYTGFLFEMIKIGKTTYLRRGEGEWSVKTELDPVAPLATVIDVSRPEIKTVRPAAETGETTEKSVTVYESSSKGNKMLLSNGSVDEWKNTTKYWFDSQGRFLKIESVTYAGPQKEFIRDTKVYEYDKGITIEAPTL
ncbi:MAG: hypothetical protein QM785_15365 [Pyrinomonadaceae bacterium]